MSHDGVVFMLKNYFLSFLTLFCMGFLSVGYSQETSSTEDSSPAAKVYKEVSGSVFTIYGVGKTEYALESAVAVGKHLLATNCHVAFAGNYLKIKIDGVMKDGTLSYYDRENDLCLVNVDDAEFIPVNIRPSKEIDIGEDVYAIGNPEGYERTISKGIISNKDNINGKFMLQTDAPISHGSSGGGLFDVHANLIGITTLIGSEGENLGFAIPSEILLAQVNPNLLPKGGSIQATSSLNTDKNTNRSLTKMDYSVPSLIGYYGDSKIA
jgi:S1-C subfamily serine protease